MNVNLTQEVIPKVANVPLFNYIELCMKNAQTLPLNHLEKAPVFDYSDMLTVKQSRLFFFIELCLRTAHEENNRIIKESNNQTRLLEKELKACNEISNDLQRRHNNSTFDADAIYVEMDDVLDNLSSGLSKQKDKYIRTLNTQGEAMLINRIYKLKLECFEGKVRSEIAKNENVSDFIELFNERKQLLKKVSGYLEQKLHNEKKAEKLLARMDKVITSVYKQAIKEAEQIVDTELNAHPLSLYGDADPENHQMLRFKCNKIAEDLTLIITELGRNNSITKLENAMRIYFPNALLKSDTLTALVRALNNPRPSRQNKNCKRYIHATQGSDVLECYFDFEYIHEIINELIVDISKGRVFKTENQLFYTNTIEFYNANKDHYKNYEFVCKISKKMKTGNKQFDNACNKAKTARILDILEKLNFDTQAYLQSNYKPEKIITHNAKGGPRLCKTSDMQLKLTRIHRLEPMVAA